MDSKLSAVFVVTCLLCAPTASAAAGKKPKAPQPTALDQYIKESLSHEDVTPAQPSAGSLWTSASRFTDLGSDLRAIHVNDLVTIVVNEQATAVAAGATQTSRASTLSSAVTSLAGPRARPAHSPICELRHDDGVQMVRNRQPKCHPDNNPQRTGYSVLPNGFVCLEGTKDVQVNSEFQPSHAGHHSAIDLDTANIISLPPSPRWSWHQRQGRSRRCDTPSKCTIPLHPGFYFLF